MICTTSWRRAGGKAVGLDRLLARLQMVITRVFDVMMYRLR